jgi:hypothetical protein
MAFFIAILYALTAATKAETLVFSLRSVQKKLRAVLHNAEFFATFFSRPSAIQHRMELTPCYAT